MINKIQLVGKLILSPKQKEERKYKEEIENAFDVEYFNVMVKVPNGSVTLIRCLIKGVEKIENWNKELNDEDIIKVKGFLKNETNSRQIVIKVTKWEKKEGLIFENLDEFDCNSVRLVGKVTDLKNVFNEQENQKNDVISFKISCFQPIQSNNFVIGNNNENNSYFCRINDKQNLSSINIQKGDVVLIGGFLQTKKVFNESSKKIEARISTIICQQLLVLDNADPTQEFYSLNKKIIEIPIRKIDFSKPKPNSY